MFVNELDHKSVLKCINKKTYQILLSRNDSGFGEKMIFSEVVIIFSDINTSISPENNCRGCHPEYFLFLSFNKWNMMPIEVKESEIILSQCMGIMHVIKSEIFQNWRLFLEDLVKRTILSYSSLSASEINVYIHIYVLFCDKYWNYLQMQISFTIQSFQEDVRKWGANGRTDWGMVAFNSHTNNLVHYESEIKINNFLLTQKRGKISI